ncbi:hypothetical protein ABZY57_15155 [Streptomyces sp. NPDC006450]|uniref:hypothetical protein n=1 Tax=Streptomyces sp. NPDC006450 TaxID=3155458 RepID=UPI0033A7B9D9
MLTLYLQIGQRFTAGEAGLGNLPLAVGTAVGGSIGVAIFGSVFFARAEAGDFTTGFHRALIVQACLLVAFLAITFLLPRKGRPEEEQHVIPEAAADGSGPERELAA